MNRTFRLTALLLALTLLVLTLSACGDQGGMPAVGDMTYHFDTDYHPDQPTVAEGTDAYYFLKGDFLYFWDKSGGEPMALCNKPNCLHDKIDPNSDQKHNCHAYMGQARNITFYDGALYLLAKGEYGSTKPYGAVYLRKLSPQGDFLGDVCQLYGFPEGFALHRGYFYYTRESYHIEGGGNTNATSYLIQVSLSDKSERCLYFTDFISGHIDLITPYGKYIYFEEAGYDRETHDPSKPETVKTVCNTFCYDLETDQISRLNTKGSEAFSDIPILKDQTLYYTYWYYDYGDERNNVIYKNTPDGSKEEAVFTTDISSDIYADDQYLYADNWPVLGIEGFEDVTRTIRVYDGDFNEICSFSTAEVDGIDCTGWQFNETNITEDYLLFLKTGYDPEEESVLVTVSKKDIAAGNPVPHAIVF